jgi:hypothetical protein
MFLMQSVFIILHYQALRRLSSHFTQTGSWVSPRRKYLPSSNGPEQTYVHVSIFLHHLRGRKRNKTYHTDKAANMPLCPESLDNRIRNRLPTTLALCAVPMRVTIHTPCVSIFFDKRRRTIKRITALCAEKVAGVPLGTTCYNDLAFNGRLAALASWREKLVEIKVTIEPWGFIRTVIMLQTGHVFGCRMRGEKRNVLA